MSETRLVKKLTCIPTIKQHNEFTAVKTQNQEQGAMTKPSIYGVVIEPHTSGRLEEHARVAGCYSVIIFVALWVGNCYCTAGKCHCAHRGSQWLCKWLMHIPKHRALPRQVACGSWMSNLTYVKCQHLLEVFVRPQRHLCVQRAPGFGQAKRKFHKRKININLTESWQTVIMLSNTVKMHIFLLRHVYQLMSTNWLTTICWR